MTKPTTALTDAQRPALHVVEINQHHPLGLLHSGEGVRRSTLDSLIRRGRAEMIRDTTVRRLAPAGLQTRTHQAASALASAASR